MEGVIALMELANERLSTVWNRVQEYLLDESRAITRQKVGERIRAKLPTPQTKIGDTTTAKELAKVRAHDRED